MIRKASQLKIENRVVRETVKAVFAAMILSAIPQLALAHGELLIRIGAISRVIATNATPQLYLQRGELYREDKNWEAAEADYAQAQKADATLAGIDFCRAEMLIDREQWPAAKSSLDQIILKCPTSGEALIARAHVFARLNQRKSALSDFEHGVDLTANARPECFLEWAQLLAAEGRVDEALRRLDQGMAKSGPVNALQVYAMDLELGRKNNQGALKRLDAIIAAADRKEVWLMRRGDVQMAEGKLRDARLSYEAADAAIRHLPVILQRNKPMQNLQSHISGALDEIAVASTRAKVETN